MKRSKLIFIMIITCVAAVCTALFAACKPAELSVPDGFKYGNETFTWNTVDGADGYMVQVNEAEEFYITEASVSVNDTNINGALVEKEINTLHVRAVTVDGDGNVKISSETANYEFDYVVPVIKEWMVTLNLNYTDAPEAQTVTVKNGEKLNKPENPQRSGWTFGGWYRDKQCLVSADFTSAGVSSFSITANTTFYAKWNLDKSVTYTPVYFYTEDWEQVSVKPYKGETALYSGAGVEMAAFAGHTNWFKANIDDTATSVIFTDGEDATESATFDKTKPYCKNDVWTTAMPADKPVEDEKIEVTIQIGDAEPVKLEENPENEGEYMIALDLKVGDKVVIAIDGKAVSNYADECTFKGTAEAEGKHTFYVSVARIWVDAPKTSVVIVINGVTATDIEFTKNENPQDTSLSYEYFATVALKKGDKIKLFEGDFEYKNYESGCNFTGTADKDGSYTFYAKKYKDGRDSVWVTVPLDTPTTSTTVYYHNTKGWSKVYLYCWNNSSQATPAGGSWPGKEMTDMGDGWFSFVIQPGYNMVIFNNGSGVQTADLVLEVVDGVAYYTFNGVTTDRPAE